VPVMVVAHLLFVAAAADPYFDWSSWAEWWHKVRLAKRAVFVCLNPDLRSSLTDGDRNAISTLVAPKV
jgi:hypothetical protein